MICSITSSGFEIPPDQNEFQIASIYDFNSPVTNLGTVLAARRQPPWLVSLRGYAASSGRS